MSKRWELFVTLLALTPALWAATQVNVIDNGKATVQLSQKGYNRLAVQNDRILSVKGELGDYDLQADEQSGDVFLKPLRKEDFDVFVTSESFKHYQLTVQSSTTAPQSVLLVAQDKPIAVNVTKKASPYLQQVSALIRAMANPNKALAFIRKPVKEKQQRLNASLQTRRLGWVEKGNLKGELLEVVNTGHSTWTLHPIQFYQPGVAALAIEQPSLHSNAHTRVYRVWQQQ